MHVRWLFTALALAVSTACSAGQEQDVRGEVQELRKLVADQQKTIEELRRRLEALEGKKGPEAGQAEEMSFETPTGSPGGGSPGGRALMLPDLAVIGNHRGIFAVPRGYEARNRFQLAELELALQQPIYTGMNFYATVAGGEDAAFAMGVEEGYVTLSRPFKLPFDGVVGKRRLQFGKLNALHPHQWRFVDAPAAATAFLGEEGFFGNGASLNYTVPVSGAFANLEIGLWGASSAHAHHDAEHEEEGAGKAEEEEHHHHGVIGPGFAGDIPVARLWLSRAIGEASELELGVSHATGKGDNGDPIRLTGLDLTYRCFPSTYSRLQLQGEYYSHRRKERDIGTWHTRSGHYLLLSYAPDKYYEYGLRFDNTRYPWPLEGREQSLSFIVTNRLSEATLVRLQYKVGDRTSDLLFPARKGYSEVFLQFIWGGGTHTHPLQ